MCVCERERRAHLLWSQTLAADMAKIGIMEATLNQFSKLELNP